MTLKPDEAERRAKVEATAVTDDLRHRYPEFNLPHIERLEKQVRDLTWGSSSSAKNRIETLEAALRPFVEFYLAAMQGEPHGWEERHDDDHLIIEWHKGVLRVGHFTDAVATLSVSEDKS